MASTTGRDTRQVLLGAAAEEFARHGLQGARVHEIVRRADVNERMIYHHFGSKQGLYRAVLEDQWLGGLGSWEPELKEAASLGPQQGLRMVLERLFEHTLVERPLFARLALQDALNEWDGVPQVSLSQIPEGLGELYRRGQEEGVLRADCDFETFYLSALGALAGIGIIGPRFSDIRERAKRDPDYMVQLRDRTLSLLFEGVTTR
ncbi:MAG TPA: TetR/AcrR family transcriptional regulator [Candidatus Dormibacteraeota bacterium]|jgi:AcrR family transcriptional regulator|nr:TetR/AcrR family transcriptional regulator [Candidatus Dormibacteraeota bacterium]